MDPRERRSSLEKVRIGTLTVPTVGRAQRPFHQAKGDRIAREFDINLFGFPVVCRVDAVNWLVDGQHRVYGLQKSGCAGPTDEVDFEVYHGLTMAEMATMFLGRNRSTPVTAFERFGVAVTAGYPAEVAIAAIVESVGLKIGHPKVAGNVFAVGALRRVYDRDGGEVLTRVLRVLRDAFEAAPKEAFGRRLVEGLGLVLAAYSVLDDALLVRSLSALPHNVQRRSHACRAASSESRASRPGLCRGCRRRHLQRRSRQEATPREVVEGRRRWRHSSAFPYSVHPLKERRGLAWALPPPRR